MEPNLVGAFNNLTKSRINIIGISRLANFSCSQALRRFLSNSQAAIFDRSGFEERFGDIRHLVHSGSSQSPWFGSRLDWQSWKQSKCFWPGLITLVTALLLVVIVAAAVGSRQSAEAARMTTTAPKRLSPGTWTLWSSYSDCSVSCGNGGTQARTRTCLGGGYCPGLSTMTQPCQDEGYPCPTSNTFWSHWSNFSSCYPSCGNGAQMRTRFCFNSSDTDWCPGESTEAQACSLSTCIQGCSTSVYTKDDGRAACGIYIPRNLTYYSADLACQRLGGRLPEVRSLRENEDILNRRPRVAFHGMWLGADDSINEGYFTWKSSSTNVSFTNWNEGEPNDHRKNEDCIELKFDSGKWNDVGCSWTIMETMCEKFLDDQVSYWSEWSDSNECSQPCGGGIQTRVRTCLSVKQQPSSRPTCRGSATMESPCNSWLCSGELSTISPFTKTRP